VYRPSAILINFSTSTKKMPRPMTTFAENDLLLRIAEALERLAPPPAPLGLRDGIEGYLWDASGSLTAVERIARIDIGLLKNVESQRETLLENTRLFAEGAPANNALLWGARGTGKSSLVKSVHALVNSERLGKPAIALVEVQSEDIATLGLLLSRLEKAAPRRFIIFCDDLSFDAGEAAYKSMKAVLDGGLGGRPENVILYATSNRRHLLARDMLENEQATAINPGETTEEKTSLSDRFGLWLGFYAVGQDAYIEMVKSYAAHFSVDIDAAALRTKALEWATERGSRSGRTAWQFIQSLGTTHTDPLTA
jgi:predicted AAA+ superfamily ATPase